MKFYFGSYLTALPSLDAVDGEYSCQVDLFFGRTFDSGLRTSNEGHQLTNEEVDDTGHHCKCGPHIKVERLAQAPFCRTALKGPSSAYTNIKKLRP